MIKVNAKFLKNFDQKSKGLLGKEKAENIYFETRWGIHTFFLKFPIDVVILDDKNLVVKLANGLKPNRVFLWNPWFFRVLELKNGEIEKHKISLGSVININNS